MSCEDIFEPPTLTTSIDFKLLYRYFNIIDMPRAIFDALLDNILLKEGNNTEFAKLRRKAHMTKEEIKQQEEKEKAQAINEEEWFSTSEDF